MSIPDRKPPALSPDIVNAFASYAVFSMDESRTILTWNPAAERTFGFKAGEMIGQKADVLFNDDDRRAGVPEKETATASRLGVAADDHWHIHRNGRRFWATGELTPLRGPGGDVLGFVKIVRDRTDIKRATDSLDEVEQEKAHFLAKLESLLANSPVGILFVDTDLRFMRANRALSEMDAIPAEAHIGRTMQELYGDRVNHVVATFRRIIETKEPVLNQEVTRRAANDKEARHFSVNYFPVVLHDGSVSGVGGLIWEITDRKIAEQRLLDQAEQLWRSNHDLEQFASSASHDLQGPLRTIASFTDLLKARLSEGDIPKATEHATRIQVLAARLHDLVGDLLTYSKVSNVEEVETGDVNLNEVLRNVLAELEVPIQDARAEVHLESLPTIRANRTQVHQLIQNLISNAIKYRGSDPPVVTVGAERRENHWVFSVADNGIGIPRESQEKIFDVFTRLHGKGKYEGTGLGLAICRRIVERHLGRIWVESEVGKGCTFRFTLPDHTANQ